MEIILRVMLELWANKFSNINIIDAMDHLDQKCGK
jgi:hypothetical protein